MPLPELPLSVRYFQKRQKMKSYASSANLFLPSRSDIIVGWVNTLIQPKILHGCIHVSSLIQLCIQLNLLRVFGPTQVYRLRIQAV